MMNVREELRLGREEAERLRLWNQESWTPVLFYIHVKGYSAGLGLGFGMGILFSVLIYLLFGR